MRQALRGYCSGDVAYRRARIRLAACSAISQTIAPDCSSLKLPAVDTRLTADICAARNVAAADDPTVQYRVEWSSRAVTPHFAAGAAIAHCDGGTAQRRAQTPSRAAEGPLGYSARWECNLSGCMCDPTAVLEFSALFKRMHVWNATIQDDASLLLYLHLGQ